MHATLQQPLIFDLTIFSGGVIVGKERIRPATVLGLADAVTRATAALVEQYGTVDVRVMREGWERPAMFTVGKRTPSRD